MRERTTMKPSDEDQRRKRTTMKPETKKFGWYRGLNADGSFQDLLIEPCRHKSEEPITTLGSFFPDGCRIHFMGFVELTISLRGDTTFEREESFPSVFRSPVQERSDG
jgi:hypothetical protein